MKKVKISVLAAILSVMILLVGCSDGNNETETTIDSPEVENGNASVPDSNEAESGTNELEPVNLTWYYLHSQIPTDIDAVEAEFNKITQAEINATVDLIPVAGADYEEKLNTIVASGEEFDIVWASNWNFKYDQNASKGAFQDISGILEEYAPETKALFPDVAWKEMTIDGKIYGMPNFQTFTKTEGFVIQKRFADKYDLDVSSIENYKDLEPFLEQIEQNEEDIIPYATGKNAYSLGGIWGNVWDNGITVNFEEPDKVVPFDSETSKEHLKLMREWYLSGYINSDAATADRNLVIQKGNWAVTYTNTVQPGSEVAWKKRSGQDVVFATVSDTIYTGVTATLNAISRTSKHPERALMLLELVNTNADAFNLLKFGIEGKHYNKVSDNVVKMIPDSGYNQLTGWVFGNVTNGYLLEEEPKDKYIKMVEMNESAIPAPQAGFTFDNSSVKTELANESAVTGQYSAALNTGSVDFDEYYPRYIKAMEEAGAYRIHEERQRQYTEWWNSK